MAKKILIADDESSFCTLLKQRLSVYNYEVSTALDGQEALNKILQEKPDLLILDVMMPKLTGYQLFEKLNAYPEHTERMPVIVISANPRMKNFFDSWKTFAFLSKPFEAEELLNKIESALDRPSLRSDLAGLSGNATQEVLSGENKKTVLVAAKNDFIAEKIKEFLESLGLSVTIELEDHCAIKAAENSKFDFILCQFWEDSSVFDAVKVYNEIKAMPHLQSVPFALFCISALTIDAKQAIEKIPIIPFTESADLKQGLLDVLKRKSLVSE